jgi:hypothetical protein
MKIVWVSPHGDGWSIAAKLREAGNRVVYFCPDQKNKNGASYLPRVTNATWLGYAERSDLVIVDGNFNSRATRRSWEPSDFVRDLQQLRHKGVRVIGPTPTSELLENDPRYLRKVLKKCGLQPGNLEVSGAFHFTVSRDPDGRCFLVFRHRHLLGEGNGPELGNLGDLVIPVPADLKIIQRVLCPIDDFLGRTGFSSYLNVEASAGHQDDVYIHNVQARFIYPAIFAQIGHLLAPEHGQSNDVGLAVTLLSLDQNAPAVFDKELLDSPGFFGGYVAGDGNSADKATIVGDYIGAVVGHGASWQTVQEEVYSELASLVRNRPGWGFRPGVGSTVLKQLESLHEWGWM